MEGEIGTRPVTGSHSQTATVAKTPWLVSPAFDLLFVANVGWLVLWLASLVSGQQSTTVEFWQIYFLTTPHRWLTLFLVAADPDRRDGRSLQLVVMAIVAAAVVVGVWWQTADLTCLLLIDYLWNAWHFAAQHSGVARIYSRQPGAPLQSRGGAFWERTGLRGFVVYVVLRLAGWTTGWTAAAPNLEWIWSMTDILAFGCPAAVIWTTFRNRPWEQRGRTCYVASVCGLYAALLVAVDLQKTNWVLALTIGSALFHAVEYLAIVSYYAWQRRHRGSAGLFRTLANGWGRLLLVSLLVFGCAAYFVESRWTELWLMLNVWAAFLHYAYDGMIWKLRRPATATALGLGPVAATSPLSAGRA